MYEVNLCLLIVALALLGSAIDRLFGQAVTVLVLGSVVITIILYRLITHEHE